MRIINRLIIAAFFLNALTFVNISGAKDSTEIFRFGTEFTKSHNAQKEVRTSDFSEWDGKALSTNTFLIEPGMYHEKFLKRIKWLPVGADNQAVEFDAPGKINPQKGSFSIWVTGLNWNINSTAREPLVTIKGDKSELILGKRKPDNISVYNDNGIGLDIPVDFNPNKMHQIVVNYNDNGIDIFIDSSGSGYGTNAVPGNYRLKTSSPCINHGALLNWMDADAVDLDGKPRISPAQDGIVDMGCYETTITLGTLIMVN